MKNWMIVEAYALVLSKTIFTPSKVHAFRVVCSVAGIHNRITTKPLETRHSCTTPHPASSTQPHNMVIRFRIIFLCMAELRHQKACEVSP
jgi:hypothetical protein